MNIKSEEEWAERAAVFLKHKLSDTELNYAELAKRLRKHGLKETEASITNKLARGTFPATFFLACIAALELEGRGPRGNLIGLLLKLSGHLR